MATSVQISCINKDDLYISYERITHVGGIRSNQRWKLTLDEAIGNIEKGTYLFLYFCKRSFQKSCYSKHIPGKKCLKTEADSDTPDNLLILPESP